MTLSPQQLIDLLKLHQKDILTVQFNDDVWHLRLRGVDSSHDRYTTVFTEIIGAPVENEANRFNFVFIMKPHPAHHFAEFRANPQSRSLWMVLNAAGDNRSIIHLPTQLTAFIHESCDDMQLYEGIRAPRTNISIIATDEHTLSFQSTHLISSPERNSPKKSRILAQTIEKTDSQRPTNLFSAASSLLELSSSSNVTPLSQPISGSTIDTESLKRKRDSDDVKLSSSSSNIVTKPTSSSISAFTSASLFKASSSVVRNLLSTSSSTTSISSSTNTLVISEPQLTQRRSALTHLKNYSDVGQTIQLREYQKKRYNEILNARIKVQSNHSAQHYVVHLPTGAGKTIIFGTIIKVSNETTWVIAPYKYLVEQIHKEFTTLLGIDPSTCHIMKNSDMKSLENIIATKKIIISTIAFLQTNERYLTIPWDRFSSLVVDEAHHALSEKCVAMITAIQNKSVSTSFYTATPIINEKSLEKFSSCYRLAGYDAIGNGNPVTSMTIHEAIDSGANCPVVAATFTPNMTEFMKLFTKDVYTRFDKTGKKILKNKRLSQKSNFNLQNVNKQLNSPKMNKSIVDIYVNGKDPKNNFHFRGLPGIYFCSGINHAIAVAQTFNQLSINEMDPDEKLRNHYADNKVQEFISLSQSTGIIPTEEMLQKTRQKAKNEFSISEAVYSKTSKTEQLDSPECQEILRRFRQGGILVLTGADILAEGFDDRRVSFVLRARTSGAERYAIQPAGRGLRLNSERPEKICYVFEIEVPRLADQKLFVNYLRQRHGVVDYHYGDVTRCRHNTIAQSQTPIELGDKAEISLTFDSPHTLSNSSTRPFAPTFLGSFNNYPSQSASSSSNTICENQESSGYSR